MNTKFNTYATVLTVTGPPAVQIQAAQETILRGESTTLAWDAVRADTVSIDNGIGSVSKVGTYMVTPTETTTYTITATGPEGTATASVTVTVNLPVPAVQINAAPESIMAGEFSTLSWSADNADTCHRECLLLFLNI